MSLRRSRLRLFASERALDPCHQSESLMTSEMRGAKTR